MARRIACDRPRRLVAWLVAGIVVIATTLVMNACGGGDDSCSGDVVVTGGEAECEAVAEEFACSSFELNGDLCSVFGCDNCSDVIDDDDDDDF